MNRKKMADLFNEKFNQNRSYVAMKKFCVKHKLSRDFEKDKKPPNKTSFKKGCTPHNAMELWQEYVHPQSGLVMIKTPEGRVFKHHYMWGEEIPPDHCVTFKDGDKKNCNKENLILVSRSEFAIFSRCYSSMQTPEYRESLILMAKLRDLARLHTANKQ